MTQVRTFHHRHHHSLLNSIGAGSFSQNVEVGTSGQLSTPPPITIGVVL